MEDGYPRKVAAFMAANPPPPLEVWKCNWKSVRLFGLASRKWLMGPGGPVSLDLAQARILARAHGIGWHARRLADLDTMEREAVKQIAALRK